MSLTAPEPLPLPLTARRFFAAVLERKLRIGLFVGSVAVVTAVLALLLKPWYTAETTLLPPSESSDMFSNLAGLIENSALNKVGLFSTSTPSDIYEEILKSRRLRESLANKFDLRHRYDVKTMDATLKELDQHLKIALTPSGVVVIRMEDHDKKMCADMANFMVSELDRFNRETLNTKGKRSRQFLEARLGDVEKRMHEADAALTAYEEKHKVVVGTDESAVRGIADVMAQKLNLQVKRAYVESYAPGSPQVSEIDAEISAFDRELAPLPALKNEGARLALDATIQRKLFSFVTAQYEDARLQELRDTPTVTVLDVAQPPEIRTRPKRTLMVVAATLLATLAALGWVALSLRRTARA
jgi:tyrosine-protein kinase Etk/Wzc